MKKEAIRTTSLQNPEDRGRPFSNAVRGGSLLFVAGQVSLSKPAKDIKGQVAETLDKIKLILEDSGTKLENVVSVRVFLKDMQRDYELMNETYREYFPKEFPARTTIQAGTLYDECLVEIDVTAVMP